MGAGGAAGGRAARLDKITFPPTLTERADDPDVKNVMASESKLFEVRTTGRAGQKAQLRERIAQLERRDRRSDRPGDRQDQGNCAGRKGTGRGSLALRAETGADIPADGAGARPGRGSTASGGSIIASRAQAKGKITETELQIIQVDKDLVSEVSKDLRETNDKIGEFVERKVTAEDQLRRIDIRAPQDGMVLQSTVHTVGGVITAGDAIMMIVPQADDLSVEAKVNPQDIDKLQIGQKTLLRLSAFNQRTTPELNGVVSRVSADVTTDQRTGQSYYTIRVSMPPRRSRPPRRQVKLIPGMPVEAFVQTGDRTMLSYLMKPLSDQLMRAFREK